MMYLRKFLSLTSVTVLVSLMALLPVLAQDEPTVPADRYEGEGFSLFLPPHATVEESEPGTTQILGPDLTIRPADADFTVSGSAYQLTITTFDNPDGLTSEEWATERILSEWQQARDQNEPTGSLPVTDEGILADTEIERVLLNDRDAFRVNFFGGDATIVNLYVAHDNGVVVFSTVHNIVENNPLALMQQDIYALLLASVEFVAAE